MNLWYAHAPKRIIFLDSFKEEKHREDCNMNSNVTVELFAELSTTKYLDSFQCITSLEGIHQRQAHDSIYM